MALNHFDVLILLGRPASGKSEIIYFFKKTPVITRCERYHLGLLDEIDDFPMLWTWFEEDAVLEKQLSRPRMHTDKEGYFLYQYQWDLLVRRLCLEYNKRLRDRANYHDESTTLIEFSRGSEHGGYSSAFQHLSEQVLQRAAILYVNVTFEESLRKNRRRFNPEKPDSILEHGLPDEKLKKLYKEVDWHQLSAADPEYITIKDIRVPYAVFENMPEKTDDFSKLAPALQEVMARLWSIYAKK